ncbi:hypothetical protein BDV93DRAFT_562566 [Ceratobasidium sp. AG-I]|nr:hypothetical protein BDV93DRAFT_562566 [Ceratobasidium sp. AG-I]
MSTYIAKPGDTLLIPCASTLKGDSTDAMSQVDIVWQQNLSDKRGSYHTGLVQVMGKPGEQVLFFIQSDWYVDGSSVPIHHLSKITHKVGDFYQFTINEYSRYGQKNAQGENRFIVFHDNSRSPYQASDTSSLALRVTALGLGSQIATRFGVSEGIIKDGVDKISAVLGDPLRQF